MLPRHPSIFDNPRVVQTGAPPPLGPYGKQVITHTGPTTDAAFGLGGIGVTSATDAAFSAFQSLKNPQRNVYTGVYVFAINPKDNSVHWAFGRKIPPKRRVPHGWTKTPKGQKFKVEVLKNKYKDLPNLLAKYDAPLVGAAGTDDKYHGKWASLGGGSDKAAHTILDAARIELNDEAAVQPPLQQDQIFVPLTNRPFVKGKTRATLVGSDQPNHNCGVYIFVFKWENFEEFLDLFPPVKSPTLTRGGPVMAKASHGEIDYAQSFSPTEVLEFWNGGLCKGENFFTAYTMRSFQTIVMNIAEEHSDFLVTTKKHKNPLELRSQEIRALKVKPDTHARDPKGWRDNFIYVL